MFYVLPNDRVRRRKLSEISYGFPDEIADIPVKADMEPLDPHVGDFSARTRPLNPEASMFTGHLEEASRLVQNAASERSLSLSAEANLLKGPALHGGRSSCTAKQLADT